MKTKESKHMTLNEAFEKWIKQLEPLIPREIELMREAFEEGYHIAKDESLTKITKIFTGDQQ